MIRILIRFLNLLWKFCVYMFHSYLYTFSPVVVISSSFTLYFGVTLWWWVDALTNFHFSDWYDSRPLLYLVHLRVCDDNSHILPCWRTFWLSKNITVCIWMRWWIVETRTINGVSLLWYTGTFSYKYRRISIIESWPLLSLHVLYLPTCTTE